MKYIMAIAVLAFRSHLFGNDLRYTIWAIRVSRRQKVDFELTDFIRTCWLLRTAPVIPGFLTVINPHRSDKLTGLFRTKP